MLISIVALGLSIFYFANRQDQAAIAGEVRLVRTAFSQLSHGLEQLAEENSWWDDAVANLVLTEDRMWMTATIGDAVTASDAIDGVVIIRPDGSTMYRSDESLASPTANALLENGLNEAIQSLEPIDDDVGVTDHGFLLVDSNLYAIGMSMVQPAGHVIYEPPLGATRRPVMVFYRQLHSSALAELANALNIKSLEYGAENNATQALLPLQNILGKPIGQLSWDPFAPGSNLIGFLALPAVLFLTVMSAAFWIFMRRAQQTVDGLKAADRAKSTFLTSVSHELRTPLNSIVGFADMLRMGYYGEIEGVKNKEYVDIIHASGEHLLGVVNDILDLSRLEAGQILVMPSEFDPKQILEEAISMVQPIASERSVTIVSALADTRLHSDKRLMRQILINILTNAVKFTPSGGHVSVFSETGVDFYRVIVSDTGAGMSDDQIDIALEPFGQVDSDQNRIIEGTGLGLPLASRFTKALKGDLRIFSTPGEGTRIYLEFPLELTRENVGKSLTVDNNAT